MANEKRLIDANALMDEFRNYMVERYDKEKCVSEENCKTCEKSCLWRKMVMSAPTVDAVEVVCCKDCKHWTPSGSMAGNREDDLQPIGGCIWAVCCRKANDFCSYGERRTDNG